MKRRLVAIVLCFVLVQMFSVTAFADCAPKPVTVVYTTGEGSETVWITLLGEKGEFPGGVVGKDELESDPQTPKALAWNAFVSYEDPDGLFFGGDLFESSGRWGYFAPDPFRVALYFPETDVLLVSEQLFERYAFQSQYQLNLDQLDKSRSGVVSMTLDGSVDWFEELLRLIPRILITFGIEILLALLWGYRSRRQIRLILMVNLVTQIGLNVLLSLWYVFDGPLNAMLMLLRGELVVLVVESIFYVRRLPDGSERLTGSKAWAFIYTVAANVLSCYLGFQILEWLNP